MLIDLNKIRIDGGTQPRAAIDEEVVSEYIDHLGAGGTFPPVVVFDDSKQYWLADGFHRYHAHKRAQASGLPVTAIQASVRQGTQRDAILYSVGANAVHGLRRTNADKRRAVQCLLDDPEWRLWSDRQIGEKCAVSHELVRQMRPSLSTVDSEKPEPRQYTTKHGATATMNTARIGKGRGEDVTVEGEESFDDPIPQAPLTVLQRAKAQESEFKELMGRIQSLRQAVAQFSKKPVAAYLSAQDIDIHLKNAWASMKFALPAETCPYCGGDRCNACRDTGWMPREVYDRAPKELKK